MSVEFDIIHHDCYCCEPLNLVQHCCAIALASPLALAQLTSPLSLSTCSIESIYR